MDDDDPKAWRTAVDGRTGREYYYHRVTRVSRWTRPPCLEALLHTDETHQQPQQHQHQHEETAVSERKATSVIPTPDDDDDDDDVAAVEAAAVDASGGSSSVGGAFHAALADAVHSLISSHDDDDAVADALMLIASGCGVSVETTLQLATADDLINNLVVLMMRGAADVHCRRLALRVLCALAYCVETAECFRTNQSWVILASKAGR